MIYEQKEGVIKVIKPLMGDSTITFYCRYVDNTLLVVKPQHVSRIHKLSNGFDKSLKFTDNMFENEVTHFLDLEMSPDGISI